MTTVESAADALVLLKDDPKAFDLVLTGALRLPRRCNPIPLPTAAAAGDCAALRWAASPARQAAALHAPARDAPARPA